MTSIIVQMKTPEGRISGVETRKDGFRVSGLRLRASYQPESINPTFHVSASARESAQRGRNRPAAHKRLFRALLSQLHPGGNGTSGESLMLDRSPEGT